MPSEKKPTSKKTTKKKQSKKTTLKKPSSKSKKRPASIISPSVYHKASLLVLSPYRFPVDAEKLAIQSARLVGLAFVFIGAVLTVFHVPGVSEQLYSGANQIQQASVLDALKGTQFAVVHGSASTNLPNDLRTRKIADSEILSGYSKPNTPTLIYFFTAPAVASIVTDEQGGWTYDAKNLSLKSERVAYVAVTDNALMPEPQSMEDGLEAAILSAKLDTGVMNLLLSVGIVLLGLVLLLLGMHLRANSREKLISKESLSPSAG